MSDNALMCFVEQGSSRVERLRLVESKRLKVLPLGLVWKFEEVSSSQVSASSLDHDSKLRLSCYVGSSLRAASEYNVNKKQERIPITAGNFEDQFPPQKQASELWRCETVLRILILPRAPKLNKHSSSSWTSSLSTSEFICLVRLTTSSIKLPISSGSGNDSATRFESRVTPNSHKSKYYCTSNNLMEEMCRSLKNDGTRSMADARTRLSEDQGFNTRLYFVGV
ncbi:hypothetical protein TNCV_3076601 [Trichonephila clavipes]|nr:hypothetical protein TNCV_3076601 [Trichonephila clavipes]